MDSVLDQSLQILKTGPVLVTGGGGFVGRNLLDRLVSEGIEVVTTCRSVGPRLGGVSASVQLISCDLLDSNLLTETVAKIRPVVVFHLAAGVAPTLAPMTILQANIAGTANLLASLVDAPLRKFVYVGSGFEYGEGANLSETAPLRPRNIYGATKAAGHLLAHSYRRSRGFPVVSARLFTPFGAWEANWRLIPFVIARVLDGGELPLTQGYQQRDYVYVSDVVDALVRSAAAPTGDDAEAINIASGKGITVREVVADILELTGNRVTANFGALPQRPSEMMVQSGDGTKARDILGWKPTVSLREGIGKTIEWVKANRDLLARLA